jgi:hypothetical protein
LKKSDEILTLREIDIVEIRREQHGAIPCILFHASDQRAQMLLLFLVRNVGKRVDRFAKRAAEAVRNAEVGAIQV